MDPWNTPQKANTGRRRYPPTTDEERNDSSGLRLVRETAFPTKTSGSASSEIPRELLTKRQWKVLVIGILIWMVTRSEVLTALILILTTLEETSVTNLFCTTATENPKERDQLHRESTDQSLTTATTVTATMAQNDKGIELGKRSSSIQGQNPETGDSKTAEGNNEVNKLLLELLTKGSNGPSFAVPLNPLPLFKGKDVTEYLRNFNQQAELTNISEDKKVALFESYTDPEIKREARQAMDGLDWEAAQDSLKEAFANEDSDQSETIEEKLEILNETRLKADFRAIVKWLNEHQYLFRQIDDNWKMSKSQSRAVYKALPEEIIEGICERHDKNVRELTTMEYHTLTQMIKRYCENKIEIRKTHRPRSEEDTHRVTWAPTPPRSPSPSVKTTKTPKILKKESDEAATSKIDQLTAQLGQLAINVAKGQESQLQLAQILEREYNRQAASGAPQAFRTNAVSLDQMQDSQDFYTTAAYGSGRGGYQSDMACWYCSGKNHFPNNCADLAYDKNNGIASYDSQGGAAVLGRSDKMLPPNLVYAFRRFGIRKLVHNWLSRFPKSDMFPLVRRMEQCNRAGINFQLTQQENIVIDDWIRKNPEAINLYRPAYKSPAGFDRLPTDVTKGNQDILDSQNPPTGTSTNVILVNEETTPSDRTGELQTITTTTVAVNANARKRVHVEDVAEAQEAAQPIRKSTPTERTPMTDKEKNQRFQTLEEKQASILRELRDEYRTKKISVAADKLFTLLPQLGREVAEDCQDIADSVEQITYVEPAPNTTGETPGSSDQKPQGMNAIQVGEQDWGESYWAEISERAGVNAILIDDEPRIERTDEVTKDLQLGDYVVTTNVGTRDEETGTVEVRQNEAEATGTDETTTGHDESIDQTTNTIELMLQGQGKAVAQSQELPRILVRLDNAEGRVIEAMVDTGSEGNIISEELARACGLKVMTTRASTTSFSQDKITMLGQATVRLYLGNVWIQQRMYVAPSKGISIPFILGMPFVRSARVSFDHSTRDGSMLLRCQLGNTRVVTPAAGSIKWEAPTYGVDNSVPLK